MKELVFILILSGMFSCNAQKTKEEPFVVEYKLEKSGGNDYKFAFGIENPFKITCDSNYYVIPSYKGKELRIHKGGEYSLRPRRDAVAILVLKFYDVFDDSLIYTDSLKMMLNRLPDPYLRLLPCDSLCNSIEDIKNIASLKGQLFYYGLDIRTSISQCEVSIIREGKTIVSVFVEKTNGEGYRENKGIQSLLTKLRIGDIVRFDNLSCKMPDLTTRYPKSKEILITE